MDSCFLPPELVEEVLSRASLETIGSCRLVSKKVNSMTYHSTFTNLFHKRADQTAGYFIEDLQKNKYSSTFVTIHEDASQLSLDFLPHRVKIEASAKQGILLCRSQEPEHDRISRYYVCKPSTKQWELIPNPKNRYWTETVGLMVMSTKPLHYKIVRLSRHKRLPQSKKGPEIKYLHCEVFDSIARAWKKLEHVQMPMRELFTSDPPVYAGGIAHWLTTEKRIMGFDFGTETFAVVEAPPLLFDGDDNGEAGTLVEYKGRLGLARTVMKEGLELWVMKDHENRKWERKWRLGLEAGVKRIEKYPSLVACYDADFTVVKGWNHVIFFNRKSGCLSVIELERFMRPRLVYAFQSDSELVDMKGQ